MWLCKHEYVNINTIIINIMIHMQLQMYKCKSYIKSKLIQYTCIILA